MNPRVIPKSLQALIESLSLLPGVGPRTAERYAHYLLRADELKVQSMAEVLAKLHGNVSYCPVTFALIEKGQKLSPLYEDPNRDKKVVAVVADAFDIVAIEKSGSFSGTYHVLGGLISPIEGIGPEQLHIKELLKRIVKDKVKELILATNASVEGESTALLITQEIGKRPVKITRLARGLPVGLDLEYADQITLARAFEGRQAV
ncbi:MAG TPA: recombination mediator RecR [Candidatus Saccharimonadales bacterium]|nr:recombination mediator RecR [Candidatus Saccharimonadales bacterium]